MSLFALRTMNSTSSWIERREEHLFLGKLGCKKGVFGILTIAAFALIILGALAMTGVIPAGMITGTTLLGSGAATFALAIVGYCLHYRKDKPMRIGFINSQGTA